MNWRENLARSKEALGAFWRQGLHELGAALYGPGTAAQPPEYGMPHTRTPGEVDRGRRADAHGLTQESASSLEANMNPAEASRDGRERDDRGLERE
jgi:hypothetical protein